MSNMTLQLLFKDKIWSHKTNSIQRLTEAKKTFAGVELDIVFERENRNFDVNHPPDKSLGISLSEYFTSQQTNSDIKYWLDFKNLDADTDSLSLLILDSIVTLHHIPKSNVIVESGSPQYLKGFLKQGFKTSYYLPKNIREAKEPELSRIIETIKENGTSDNTSYISFEYREYPLLKEKFPNAKKIIWFNVYGSMNKLSARLLLFNLLMDDQVDVLLIPFDEN